MPLQFVYVMKLFILKVGNGWSAFFCEYMRGGKEERLIAALHVTDLSVHQLWPLPQPPPLREEWALTHMHHLKLFKRQNIIREVPRKVFLLFGFFFEDWGKEYLPLNYQHKTGYWFLTLMFLLELNTKYITSEGNTFLIKFPTF